ncbi:ankyrin repeat protein [Streptomyces sp. TE33382]
MSDYWTPAHHAVEHEDAETLARLLANGADPDEVFSSMTLLTHAIDTEGDGALQSGQPLTVHTTAVLLAFGADPELADPDGRTPLGIATYYAHDLAVQLLRTHISRRSGRSGTRRRIPSARPRAGRGFLPHGHGPPEIACGALRGIRIRRR